MKRRLTLAFALSLILVGHSAISADTTCSAGENLVITTPRSGTKTLNTIVTVRGYSCINYPIIAIRNLTTDRMTFVQTDKVCQGDDCAYHFAVPVRELVLGKNNIKALVPGEDPPVETQIDIIRTALAGIFVGN